MTCLEIWDKTFCDNFGNIMKACWKQPYLEAVKYETGNKPGSNKVIEFFCIDTNN